LNYDYNNVSGKIKDVHISEPIIGRFFPQNLCHFVDFRAVLIHSTLCKALAPFSFNHVIDPCPLLISFISFPFFSPFFLDFFLMVVKILIKQLFYSGLLDIK